MFWLGRNNQRQRSQRNCVIEQKFLELGHTHLECDSDHSTIERKKKNNVLEIFHPHDWVQLIKCCGSKSNKFTVIEMKITDFFDFSLSFKSIFQKSTKNKKGSFNEIE